MEIKNVIICGLGALGLTYANKLKNVCNLKILANFERIENYIAGYDKLVALGLIMALFAIKSVVAFMK